jgi:hypothetical protein
MTTERACYPSFWIASVSSDDEREKLFKGLVDNSVLAEARAVRAAAAPR